MKGLSKDVKNHDFKETHYSVRQNIGDAGSISTQNIFPLHSVVSKRLESPYGAKYGGVYFVFLRQEGFRQPPRKHFVSHGKILGNRSMKNPLRQRAYKAQAQAF